MPTVKFQDSKGFAENNQENYYEAYTWSERKNEGSSHKEGPYEEPRWRFRLLAIASGLFWSVDNLIVGQF